METTLDPISPELVLVDPELRRLLLSRMASGQPASTYVPSAEVCVGGDRGETLEERVAAPKSSMFTLLAAVLINSTVVVSVVLVARLAFHALV